MYPHACRRLAYYTSHVCARLGIRFQAKRDNAKMTGTGSGKEVKYNEIGVILDILERAILRKFGR